MTVSGFFGMAPVQPPVFHRELMASLNEGRSLLGLFPLGEPALLWTLVSALMMRSGWLLMVSPEAERWAHSLDRLGFEAPEVGLLTDLMPAELAQVTLQRVNYRKTRLLIVTPKVLERAPLVAKIQQFHPNHMVVDGAQWLVPGFYHPQGQFLKKGLKRLSGVPKLLLGQPLFPASVKALTKQYPVTEVVQATPSIDCVTVSVKLLATDFQKLQWLRRFDQPELVVNSETSARQLKDLGYSRVYWQWDPPPERSRQERLIFWDTPDGEEVLWRWVTRKMPEGWEPPRSEIWVLHTKEQVRTARRHIQGDDFLVFDSDQRARLHALKTTRRWILGAGCRLQRLVEHWQDNPQIPVPPCGQCDQCLHPTGGWGRTLLKHLLY
jgi:hypothetical protein